MTRLLIIARIWDISITVTCLKPKRLQMKRICFPLWLNNKDPPVWIVLCVNHALFKKIISPQKFRFHSVLIFIIIESQFNKTKVNFQCKIPSQKQSKQHRTKIGYYIPYSAVSSLFLYSIFLKTSPTPCFGTMRLKPQCTQKEFLNSDIQKFMTLKTRFVLWGPWSGE